MVKFEADEVELEVSGHANGGGPWPTVAMSERVALCEGSVYVEPTLDDGERLVVRLPESQVEAFA